MSVLKITVKEMDGLKLIDEIQSMISDGYSREKINEWCDVLHKVNAETGKVECTSIVNIENGIIADINSRLTVREIRKDEHFVYVYTVSLFTIQIYIFTKTSIGPAVECIDYERTDCNGVVLCSLWSKEDGLENFILNELGNKISVTKLLALSEVDNYGCKGDCRDITIGDMQKDECLGNCGYTIYKNKDGLEILRITKQFSLFRPNKSSTTYRIKTNYDGKIEAHKEDK